MPTLRLNAVLGLNKTGFDAGIQAASKQVAQFGVGLKNHILGALSAGSFLAFGRSIIETGGQIKDLSDRLGVSAKDVQQFSIAARLGGQDAEVFARAVEKIRISMAKGDNPLEAFGITMADMQSGDAVGVLRKLGVAMQGFTGSPAQTKAFLDTFGRGFGGVINMLRELPSTGGVVLFSDKQVRNLDLAGDLFTKLLHSVKAMAALHPSLASLGFLFPDKGKAAVPTPIENIEAQERARDEAAKAHMATQDRILQMEKEAAEIAERTRVSQLSQDERRNELIAEREKIFSRIAKTEEERFAKELALKKNEAELVAIALKQDREVKRGRSNIEESALGRIGAFSGGSANAGLASGQQAMLARLTQIHIQLAAKGIIVKDTR